MPEVDLTERVVDPYTEVAKRLFNEFLEMLIALRTQGGVTPDEQRKVQRDHDREVKSWREANAELKAVCKKLTEENNQLSAEVDRLSLDNENMRLKLNQAIINQQTVARKIDHVAREYPFEEHMSERVFKEWQKLMKELPSLRGDDDA